MTLALETAESPILNIRNKGVYPMRKIALVAAVSAAALSLAACSEGTEEAAENTVEGAAADTEANAEAMGDSIDNAAAEAETEMDEAGAEVEAEADEAEAEMEGEM